MAGRAEIKNMALFCDFENIALGVRQAKYPQFDIQKILERLFLKGNIVVRKAYCDWERYKEFKASMHEAGFELIEIPDTRQSGKNSADIRLVVDALDLCYTKAHVDTFVVISGDSDFSPLVAKLRENDRLVIGVGVKKSTSDLLTAAYDEFIYYDDLVQEEMEKKRAVRKPIKEGIKAVAPEKKREPDKQQQAIEMVLETVEALQAERGEEERVRSSLVKQTLKRRKPGFNEAAYGFRSFSALLEEADRRGLVHLERDQRSGGYIVHPPAQGSLV